MKFLLPLFVCLGMQNLVAADQETTAAPVVEVTHLPSWLTKITSEGKAPTYEAVLEIGQIHTKSLTLQTLTNTNLESVKACLRIMLSDPATMSKYMAGDHFTGDALESRVQAHITVSGKAVTDGTPRLNIFLGDKCIGFARLMNPDMNDFAKEPLKSGLTTHGIDLKGKGVAWTALMIQRDYWGQDISKQIMQAFLNTVIPFYQGKAQFPFGGGGALSHIYVTHTVARMKDGVREDFPQEGTEHLLAHCPYVAFKLGETNSGPLVKENVLMDISRLK